MAPNQTESVQMQGEELRALAIAGFDPSSGAGISADLLTFAAHGIFATAAITALTVQSTTGVRSVHPTEPDLLRATLVELETDLPPHGIKLGMLASVANLRVVAAHLQQARQRRPLAVVLDPVLHASSGASLLSAANGANAFTELLPLVDVVTPNLAEAAALSGLPCANQAQMLQCAQALQARFRSLTVVVTGGHLSSPVDLLLGLDAQPHWLPGEHIPTKATHGTGCVFASALLAQRLTGKNWLQAAREAKAFVAAAMRTASPHGKGNGPLNLIRK